MLDVDWPGRSWKLSDVQLAELETILQNPTPKVGFDAPAWTTELLEEFIRYQFNMDPISVYYGLLTTEMQASDDGGRIELPNAPESRRRGLSRWTRGIRTGVKNRSRLDALLVCIDHTRTMIRVEPTKVWFPKGSKPFVE